MAVRLKTLVQILVALLMLGSDIPQPVCAAGTSQADKPCCGCCAGMPGSCHQNKSSKSSCMQNQVQTFDKQVPARTANRSFASIPVLLFLVAPIKLNCLVNGPSILFRNSIAALPFSGGPPHALLCLWRI